MVCRPGLSRVQIEREFPAFRVSPEINGQGWWTASQRETEAEAALRAQMLFEQTVAEFGGSDERIALVMHADFKVIFLERFHRERLPTPCNTSVSTVEVDGSAARLVAYNSVRHLPAQLVTL